MIDGGHKLAVFAHGSHAIGLGHLYRVRALLQTLRRQAPEVAVLILLNDDPVAAAVFAADPAQIVSGNPMQFGDWGARALRAFAPTVALHDALDAQSEILPVLREHAVRLITVDDTSELARRQCDLRVNVLYQTPTRAGDPPTWSDLGAIFIDETFAAAANDYKVRNLGTRVLVSQGGADTFGQVPQIVAALRQLPKIYLHVVIGRAFSHDRALDAAIGGDARVTVHRDVADMAGLMLQCDIAVSGGGVTLFELAAVGVPTIAITAEPRELETMARFSVPGLIVDLGLARPFPVAKLAMETKALLEDYRRRRQLGQRCRATVNGRGLERICGVLLGAPINAAGVVRR